MTSLVLALAILAEPPTPQDVLSALETALADAVARAEPSVVAISREKSGDGQETTAVRGRESAPGGAVVPLNPFEEPDPNVDFQSFDYGSGVIIGEKGEILTAFHVVRGASRLRVRAAGRRQFDAEVLAADPRSDLAVIAPKVTPTGRGMPELIPIPLGDASRLRKGSFLLALGNPFNAARDGRASASWGILSNVARRLQPPLDEMPPVRQLRHHPTLLQLDAKLNLGMSGGAVVNLKGELVGVTTTGGDPAGFDAQAGYAIPLDAQGRRIVEALRQGKEVEYGFLGIRLDPHVSNRVLAAHPGTPAGQGGLLAGDTIIAVGGSPVTDSDSLTLALSTLPVGKAVVLKVERRGEVLEKTVVLSKYPVQGERIATNLPAPWRGLRVDFTSVLAGSMFNDAVLQAMAKGGVGVVEVEPNSPAEAVGLKIGQVITAVDGKAVRTPGDFADAVARTRGLVRLETDLGAVTIK